MEKINPSLIKIDDLSKSYRDKLLFRVRKKLRQNYGFKKGKGLMGINCIFSSEETRYPGDSGEITNSKVGLGITKLDCHGSIGSFAPTTGVFGLLAVDILLIRLLKIVIKI